MGWLILLAALDEPAGMATVPGPHRAVDDVPPVKVRDDTSHASHPARLLVPPQNRGLARIMERAEPLSSTSSLACPDLHLPSAAHYGEDHELGRTTGQQGHAMDAGLPRRHTGGAPLRWLVRV